jgi:hypothetical protein
LLAALLKSPAAIGILRGTACLVGLDEARMVGRSRSWTTTALASWTRARSSRSASR